MIPTNAWLIPKDGDIITIFRCVGGKNMKLPTSPNNLEYTTYMRVRTWSVNWEVNIRDKSHSHKWWHCFFCYFNLFKAMVINIYISHCQTYIDCNNHQWVTLIFFLLHMTFIFVDCNLLFRKKTSRSVYSNRNPLIRTHH